MRDTHTRLGVNRDLSQRSNAIDSKLHHVQCRHRDDKTHNGWREIHNLAENVPEIEFRPVRSSAKTEHYQRFVACNILETQSSMTIAGHCVNGKLHEVSDFMEPKTQHSFATHISVASDF